MGLFTRATTASCRVPLKRSPFFPMASEQLNFTPAITVRLQGLILTFPPPKPAFKLKQGHCPFNLPFLHLRAQRCWQGRVQHCLLLALPLPGKQRTAMGFAEVIEDGCE